MPAAPRNALAITARPQTILVARVGPDDGAPPTPENAADEFRVLDLELVSGGGRLDSCRIEYDLGVNGERVEHLQTPTGFSRAIEVYAVPDPGALADGGDPAAPAELQLPLFAGDLDMQSITLRSGQEGVVVAARLQRHHFGDVLVGPVVYDPESEPPQPSKYRRLAEDLRVNPLIDGEIEPNRSTRKLDDVWYIWVDPESVRTDEAREYREALDDPELWDLRELLRSLCYLLNREEEHIKNPDLGEPAEAGGSPGETPEADIFHDAPKIENLTLPRGGYLPDYLDAILPPHGYGWHVAVSEAEPDGGGLATLERRITIFRRTAGPRKVVRLQQLHAVHDPRRDNLPALSVDTDVADLANEIICDGGFKEIEVTIELYRGWPESDDDLTPAELKRSDPESLFYREGKHDAWRLWIANEAADYSATRETVAPIPEGPGFQLDPELIRTPRRRTFGECLTLDESGRRREPYVEFHDPQEDRWRPVPREWGYDILETQLGVRFTGDTPPDELVDLGEDARIRVTATVPTDARLTSTAERQPESPSGRTVKLWLDVSDRFAFRELRSTGEFASRFWQDPEAEPPEDEPVYEFDDRDDTDEIKTYAEVVRAVEESASITASITLAGIDLSYRIGDVLVEVAGRGISFNRNSRDSQTKKYLQVTGLRYDVRSQTTTLVTQPADVTADTLYARNLNAP